MMLKHIIDRCNRRLIDGIQEDNRPDVPETYDWSVSGNELFYKLPSATMLPPGYADNDDLLEDLDNDGENGRYGGWLYT